MNRLLLMVCLFFKLDELVIYLLFGGLIHLQLLFGLHSLADYRHFVVSGDGLKDGGAKRLGGRRVVGRLQPGVDHLAQPEVSVGGGLDVVPELVRQSAEDNLQRRPSQELDRVKRHPT